MRKSLRYVFVTMALLCAVNTATMADMNEAPAPVQTFQQAIGTDTTANPATGHSTNIKLSSDNNMVKTSLLKQTPVDQQAATVLQAELTQLNQNNLLYQQKTDAQLD